MTARGRGPDPLLRALAVVGLVVVASVALRARQGLDWDRLADPAQVRWARVLVGSLLLLVLVLAVRRVLSRLRRALSLAPPGDDERAEPEGQPVPWWLRLLAALLVLGTLAAVFFLLTSLESPPPGALRNGPAPSGSGAGRPGPLDTGSTWRVLLVVGAVLLGAALVSRWQAARRTGTAEEPADAAAEEVARLVAAVDAADAGLRSEDDPRAAVLAAYRAMAGQLSSGLARRGRAARGSDTATELLDHAVRAGLVSGSPAGTLTALFREARYSRHPMGEPDRGTALRCLAEVRAELRARRG